MTGAVTGAGTGARTVYLGNHQAAEVRYAENDSGQLGEQVRTPVDGKRCTTVTIPADMPFAEALANITHPRGVWTHHSDADAPAWVASDWPAMAAALAEHYGCEIRDPDPDPTGV